jgi:hypothetical protein
MASTAVIGPYLVGRPVIWDREDETADESASPRIHIRAARLSRGLTAMGVRSHDRVVVLCCAEHAEDRQVAVAAARKLGAVPIIPLDWSISTLTPLLADLRNRAVHLACEEGVEAWRAAYGKGIMIGEGFEVLWWRALECRYAPD